MVPLPLHSFLHHWINTTNKSRCKNMRQHSYKNGPFQDQTPTFTRLLQNIKKILIYKREMLATLC